MQGLGVFFGPQMPSTSLGALEPVDSGRKPDLIVVEHVYLQCDLLKSLRALKRQTKTTALLRSFCWDFNHIYTDHLSPPCRLGL